MVALVFSLVLGTTAIPPLTADNSVPFVMPWDDNVAGTITDMSYLNEKPAGKNGPITARNGHFYEGASTKRVRFLATNLGARAAFPTKEEAPLIAKRLAKLGINLVRFHHMNNGWDPEGSVWKKGRTFVEIDPAMLDRFDFFVAELKKQGIYSNVNLQVSREYVPELGFPEEVRQIPSFQKKVDKVDRKMISLQKQYARDLIGRKNPYTGMSYAADPAIMVVEINNENSLCGWPGEQPGTGIDAWPPYFRNQVVTLWNQWLKDRYKTDAALAKAWPSKDTLTGKSINGEAAWTQENQSNSDVTFTPGGPGNLSVTVRNHQGPNWHIQAHVGGMSFEDGKVYTVMFDAKGDRDLAVPIDSRLSVPNWDFLGFGSTVRVGTDWKPFVFSFKATGGKPGSCRVGFTFGDMRGTFSVRNFRVMEGEKVFGVPPGETIAAGNMSLPTADISPRSRDYVRFLTELETKYSEEMRKFLREDLGFKSANIIDTQISWGNLTSLIRERQMEFADNHAYWNHPTFLGKDWDPQNYRVDRRALVNELDGNMGTMGDLANFRIAGKPYSISEYCHPAPNDYQSEMMPIYSIFGAMQDWDILYTFAYPEHFVGRTTNDRIQNFFDVGSNPAVAAFYPAAAIAFRNFGMPELKQTATLKLPKEPWSSSQFPGPIWQENGGRPNLRDFRIGMKRDEKLDKPEVTRETVASAFKSPMQVVDGNGGKVMIANSDYVVSVVGFVSERTFMTDIGQIKFGKIPGGFASLMIVPADKNTLNASNRLLVTVSGRVENTGQKWNAERTSVSDQWGTPPTLAEIVPFTIGTRGTAYALDGTGKRTRTSSLDEMSKVPSMWYEIVR